MARAFVTPSTPAAKSVMIANTSMLVRGTTSNLSGNRFTYMLATSSGWVCSRRLRASSFETNEIVTIRWLESSSSRTCRVCAGVTISLRYTVMKQPLGWREPRRHEPRAALRGRGRPVGRGTTFAAAAGEEQCGERRDQCKSCRVVRHLQASARASDDLFGRHSRLLRESVHRERSPRARRRGLPVSLTRSRIGFTSTSSSESSRPDSDTSSSVRCASR